jgi:hypothetical protein
MMAASVFYIPAQTNTTNNSSGAFDTTDLPQWVKDLRRWEIVAFGSIPFTMLFTTTGMDMYRWNNANGMDMSEEGRRYAPWPLKSSAAVLMDTKDFENVLKIAACISAGVAFTDLIIVKIKRYKARKRAEALPAGTTIINRKPWPEEAPSEDSNNDENASEARPGAPESSSPPKP